MFGSKIKTWMENHLGRPRKKSNKNKNVSPSDHITTGEQYKQKHAATGFTVYNSNGCSSPYRTNTNSNSSSGNHTGCNSSVISSPNRRREVSPIQNHTQSRYGWQSPDREHVISPKSDNFLYAPQHHSQQYLRSNHTAPNTRENSCEDNKIVSKQQQHQLNCSTSSFSSLSWSTGSKEPSMHSNNIQNINVVCHSVAAPTNNNSNITTTEIKSYTTVDTKETDDDPNAVHYEEIDEIGTLIRHPEKLRNNTINDFERPKSEKFPKLTQTTTAFSDSKQTQDDASTRYGRLLPSKIPNPIIVSFRTGSEECISRNGSQFTTQYARGDIKNSSYSQNCNGVRSKLRTGVHPGSLQGNPSAPLVSLSSPESAYSTGYSTDGTSPGTGYTPPEYYVNMRTGTHYFPKSVNSLAIEAQRYKFGLNKIEEMSPIDPLPKTSFAHRNIEENYSALAKQTIFTEPYEKSSSTFQAWETSEVKSPLPIRNTIVIPTLKGFESPSPRQRCRIRTNPWYSTTETSSSSSTVNPTQQQQQQQQQHHHHHSGGSLTNTSLTSSMTFSSTSSHSTSALSTIHLDQDFQRSVSPGIRNTTLGATVLSIKNNNSNNNNNMTCVSSESSSSLTEVENMQRCYTPNTIRQKRSLQLQYNQHTAPVATCNKKSQEVPLAVASDDDATLNEMMGKFDESYIYEKETDILSSDSDPTDCPTDMDTGQDAGDECDTDDLLDIDFIDTSSIQEINEHKDHQVNLGKCYYVQGSPLMAHRKASLRSQRRNSRSSKLSNEQTIITAAANSAQRRRKRFHKTRKKSSESRENCRSPLRKPRETRSVGGTPVCLRKRIAISEKQRFSHTTPHRLSHRSSSLVFTGVRENRFMTVAESEKALLKADFEADVKYRQLIMEAESILLSMRNSLQSISRETPVASPRRLNPLANKRVEMIKNCEIEPKRDIQKQQQHSPKKHIATELTDQELTAAVNKRIEILKLETHSPPGSPKLGQCSPRKTHLTNFINQNTPSEGSVRKNSNNSPLVQRRNTSPIASPSPQQRCSKFQNNLRPPSRTNNLQLSDSDQDSSKPVKLPPNSKCDAGIKASTFIHQLKNKGPSMSLNYCPQSEPLKRKIYKNHHPSFDRTENYNPLQEDIQYNERQELLKQQRLKAYNTGSGEFPIHNRKLQLKSNSQDLYHLSSYGAKCDFNTNMVPDKAALILSTIEDLKRNLEHQSIELNGLHDS
ncbi:serine-rich adhesin for platelets [Calliphora vicina]|uniref:serine-rich adhesin for platelets n=1 Tax=Calliphora vicina TaxID=7373 RepID=UPI00325BEF02